MHILIGDQKIDLTQGPGGRLQATFTPKEDLDYINLASDCFGNLKVSQLQVEKGDQATPFVEPQVYEAPLAGIFKDLREIKLEMTDETHSNLWSRIRANSAGMIREYHHDHISTEIAETAGQITQQIADTQRGLRSEITQTADGLERKITLDTQGKINRVVETVDGVQRKITGAESNISTLNQTASGLQAEIKSADDRITSLTLTTSGLSSRITNNAGDISTIKQTVNAYERVIGRTEWQVRSNISSIVQNSGIIQSTVRSTDLSTNDTISTIQTQLDDSWGVKIKTPTEAVTSINAGVHGIRLKGDLIHLNGRTLIDYGVIKDAHIGSLSASKLTTGTLNAANVRIINLDVNNLTGNRTNFVQTAWNGINQRAYVDSSKFRIDNTNGDFVEMNNIPEVRSQDKAGTATVMGKGRTHYYSSTPDGLSTSRFYVGSNLEGLAQYGIHVTKGQTWGIYRPSDSFGGEPAKYYTVKAGEQRVAVISNLVRMGELPDGNSADFVRKSNEIARLNGWDPLPKEWPTLKAGDQIIYKEGTPGNTSGIERIWTMGTSSNGATRSYSHTHHVFEGGTTGVSDRRIKHSIEPTKVKALDHILNLTLKEFRFKKDNRFEPIGLIAQDAGILRVQDDDLEGIDIQRAIMLALKGIQELHAMTERS